MNILKKYIPFLSIAVLVYVFYAFAYGGTLQYNEQYQLFQTTWDYFVGLLSRPGGAAMYASRFITQFFLYPAIGAIFIALLSTAIFASIVYIYKSSKYRFQTATIAALLSACTILCHLTLLNGLTCLAIGCGILLIINKIPQKRLSIALPFITVATYWIAGGIPAALIVGYCFFDCVAIKNKNKALWLSIFASAIIVIIMPMIARQVFGIQLNTTRAFLGADYFRFVVYVPKLPFLIALFVAVSPLFRFLPTDKKRSVKRLVTSWILTVFIVGFEFNRKVDFDSNEQCAIEYCARQQQWDEIIRLSSKKQIIDRATNVYLNLALAKTDQLGDKMFSFTQFGTEGLTPNFRINMNLSMALNEMYYQTGFINFSERFVFEAAKANPDYQESVRAVKRLAETSIIKENYDLARKYLKMLRNTTFYAKWARKCLRTIENDRTQSNMEWAILRNFMNDDDYFYTEQEMDMMMGKAFLSNQTNKTAYDYMMAYYLLSKNVDKFMKYYNLGEHIYNGEYPKAFREAILYYRQSKSEMALSNLSAADDAIYQRLLDFGDIYNANPKDPRLEKNFGDTFWYYLIKQ